MRFGFIVLIGGIAAAPAWGQSPGAETGRANRLSITWSGGRTFSGIAPALAEQLSEAGWGQSGAEICIVVCAEPATFPVEHGPEAPLSVTVRYSLTRILGLVGGYTRQGLGGAIGRRDHGLFNAAEYIDSVWEADALWFGCSLYPWGDLRLSVGPGIYRMESPDHRVTRAGLLAEVGFELPLVRRFFVDLALRRHVIGSSEVTDEHSGVTLRSDWSHDTVQIGLGVGF